jgi:hypothetical protein
VKKLIYHWYGWPGVKRILKGVGWICWKPKEKELPVLINKGKDEKGYYVY